MKFLQRTYKVLADWFDYRTGYRKFVHEAMYENIPGGSRWIYVTGSMLAFAFVTQVITGIFLWMCYSPSSQTAWESVHYIQNEMTGGWLLRGIHHFMAQAMIVLLPLHMLQVVLCKAYVAPREINYWLGMVLMLLTLGLGLTGYLLPWDQKGYWATKVATNLMSLAPGGPYMQKLVVGGSEYGHHTLTRFFALHAGLLPALFVLFLFLHIAIFRKHGITAVGADKRPMQHFWPHQVFKDAFACLVLLAVVLIVVVGVTNVPKLFTGELPPATELGAELGSPADAAEEYSAARPEWYFLFLFQLLKKFKDEKLGAIVVPAIVVLYLFAMPLISKIRFGHALNVIVLFLLLGGAGYLTFEAWYHDNYSQMVAEKPEDDVGKERYESSVRYLDAVERAEVEYERVQELIDFYGIADTAVDLMRNDPEIQGPRLFQRHCASCHSYTDADGQGIPGPKPPQNEDGEEIKPGDEGYAPFGAPNLYRFASREWIRGFLDPEKIKTDDFFGRTKHLTRGMMVDEVESLENPSDEEKEALEHLIVALSAEAELPYQEEADAEARHGDLLEKGMEAFDSGLGTRCADCHYFKDFEDGNDGPDLTGYGSYDWLKKFIADPDHFYNDNDRMPAFAKDAPGSPTKLLTDHEIDMLVRWLREEQRDLERNLRSRL